MTQVNVNIMGNPLILCGDSDPPPPEAHRIGTVPLYFDHGKPVFVRVFGKVKLYKDGKVREAFERELRKTCENPAIVESIFGSTGSYAKTRRFNPSAAQKKRGWYHGGCKEETAATVH